MFAAPRMYLPLDGDQTVFMMGASVMRDGGALYTDFWDTKQPGIFLFYRLAGTVFQPGPLGLRLFELLWQLVLAAWMIHALRKRLEHRWLASVAPVMAIGGYYCVAGPAELTQVEALVSLPLFACAVLVAGEAPASRSPAFAWFTSGLAAGVVLLFKFLLAPVPLAIWAIAALSARRGDGVAWGDTARTRLVPALLGTGLVLLVTALAFAAAGSLGSLVWTTFVYPFEALGSTMVSDPARLRSSVRWWATAFGMLVVFALFVRLGARPGRERLFAIVLAWFVAAALIVLIQRYSWWRYHLVLLIVPCAILAVRGIEGLVRTLRTGLRIPAPQAAAALCVVLAVVPALRVRLADPAASPPRIASHAALVQWQRTTFPAIDRIWNDTAFLRADHATPGAIYVFGDPRTYTHARRAQAIAINGWSWESYAERQWNALPGALAEARPVFIAAEPFYRELVQQRSPGTWSWIEANYEVVQEGRDRIWYGRRELAAR